MDEEARKRALRLLEKRDYSCKLLFDKLTEKGASPEAAAEVIGWLRDMRFLDDERYAGLVVRHYAAKGYGERRIRDELFRRGVDRELWDAALAQLPEADDAVLQLLRQKLRCTPREKDDLQRARNYLLRRGYSWEEIRSAMERYQAENEEII